MIISANEDNQRVDAIPSGKSTPFNEVIMSQNYTPDSEVTGV